MLINDAKVVRYYKVNKQNGFTSLVKPLNKLPLE